MATHHMTTVPLYSVWPAAHNTVNIIITHCKASNENLHLFHGNIGINIGNCEGMSGKIYPRVVPNVNFSKKP